MKPRTSQEMDEIAARTLYVRLPHTIKNSTEITNIFVGNIKVNLPRQSSRHCHVVFSSIEEKMKNLKHIRNIKIDGKRLIAVPPRRKTLEEKKKKEKKIKIPRPKPEPKPARTKTLYISNIKPGTKAQEIKDAFPGCNSVVMLKSTSTKNGGAILKLDSIQLASEYLRRERDWPEVKGNILQINMDTRKRKSKSGKKKKSTSLKIYDGEDEIKIEKNSKKAKGTKDESEDSQKSDYEEDEDESESDEEDAVVEEE